MAALVVFPDIVAVARAGLLDGLPAFGFPPDLHVASSRPDPDVVTFVLLDRTGGARSSLVTDVPQLTTDSYGDGAVEALELAGAVRAIVNGFAGTIVEGATVYHVDEVSGPGRLWDPVLEVDFYRQSFTLITRGAPAP